MISPLVLKSCFPQIEKMLFREKPAQRFENLKTQIKITCSAHSIGKNSNFVLKLGEYFFEMFH